MGLDVKIRRGEEKRQETRRERLDMKIKKFHEARRPQNDEKQTERRETRKNKETREDMKN